MLKRIIGIFIAMGIFIIFGILSQLFLIPRIINSPLLGKYHSEGLINEKTVIINKTEKVTVKENFSLVKSSEKVSPAVVKILVIQSNNLKKTKINLEQKNKTGVILSSDGAIVTPLDNELLDIEKDALRVVVNGGQVFEVEKITPDNFNGLLFLKIKADNLTVAPFGNSQELENGEKIILLGHSRMTQASVFSLNLIQEYNLSFNQSGRKFLFSDENSSAFVLAEDVKREFIGGPVVDFNGMMVGLVNSTKGINSNYSFFIPIANIEKSLKMFIAKGNVQYPKLGTYYFNITPELALLNRLPEKKGAFVYAPSGMVTIANSAGREAGLLYGDIIQEINEEEVDQQHSLSMILNKYSPGDKISLKVLRQGKQMELFAILK